MTFLLLIFWHIFNLRIYRNNQKFKNFFNLKDKKLLYIFF